MNPTSIDRPVFLMCPPFTFDTTIANNAWMDEIPTEEREVDRELAFGQWYELWSFLASEAFVYTLPLSGDEKLQDITFVANLGIVFTHESTAITTEEPRPIVAISNLKAEGRKGEADLGRQFFRDLGYITISPPQHFEGEADLKHLYDNVYVGGYGIRSDIKAFEFLEKAWGAKIVKVKLTDEHLYHLDGLLFPITADQTLVCCDALEEEDIEQLDEITEIIDVSSDSAYSGICNNVRVHNTIVGGSNIHDLSQGTEEYNFEKKKIEELETICSGLAFEPSFFNISEFDKGGAALSCLVLHLNRWSYGIDLL